MFKLNLTTKLFVLLLAGFFTSVFIGIASRLQNIESEAISLLLTMLPANIALLIFSLFFGFAKSQQAAKHTLSAIIIWMVGPWMVAQSLFGTAIGCPDGLITIDNVMQPIFIVAAVSQLAIGILLTFSYFQKLAVDNSTSIKPFVFRSLVLQLATGLPLIAINQYF